MLGNIPVSRRTDTRGAVFADFTPLPELGELQRAVYFGDGKKTITEEYLKALTPLALAVWFMDDGSFTARSKGLQARTAGGSGRVEFCVEALSEGSRARLAAYLRDTHRPRVSLRKRGSAPEGCCHLHNGVVCARSWSSLRLTCIRRWTTSCFRGSVGSSMSRRSSSSRSIGLCRSASSEFTSSRRPARCTASTSKSKASTTTLVDGVMVHNSPETTTGGRALKFYSSVRLDVRRIETLKDGTDFVGNRTRVKVAKNKVAPPFKQAEFDIMYGLGISREGGLIDVGVETGLVRKAGAWYTYEGDQLGQGKENARAFLRDNPDLANEIEKRILEKLGIGATVDADVEAAAAEPTDIDF